MRVLIVSFYFPPSNVIGAVRVGKMAKYLARFGNDVRVLTAADLPFDGALELEIPDEWVVRTPWWDIDAAWQFLIASGKATARRLRGGRAAADAPAPTAAAPAAPTSPAATASPLRRHARSVAHALRAAYANTLHVPDQYIGWRGAALRGGRELGARWRPDVILASGSPWTCFLVARDLSRSLGVPWVADFRDPWFDNPTVQYPLWRQRMIDQPLERWTVDSAAAMVTVSEPIAAKLRARHPGIPVDVVLNGFDAETYDGLRSRATTAAHDPVRIVYTGNLFRERDLGPILQALQALRAAGDPAAQVRIDIVGNRNPEERERTDALARQLGVAECLHWSPPVAHRAAAQLQRDADVLLAATGADPAMGYVFSGKLFEYVGARRPILLLGHPDGVAARLVRDRGFGVAASTADEVAAGLRRWIAEKRATGAIADTDAASVGDLSREAQARILEQVLRAVTHERPESRPAAREARNLPTAAA